MRREDYGDLVCQRKITEEEADEMYNEGLTAGKVLIKMSLMGVHERNADWGEEDGMLRAVEVREAALESAAADLLSAPIRGMSQYYGGKK